MYKLFCIIVYEITQFLNKRWQIFVFWRYMKNDIFTACIANNSFIILSEPAFPLGTFMKCTICYCLVQFQNEIYVHI